MHHGNDETKITTRRMCKQKTKREAKLCCAVRVRIFAVEIAKSIREWRFRQRSKGRLSMDERMERGRGVWFNLLTNLGRSRWGNSRCPTWWRDSPVACLPGRNEESSENRATAVFREMEGRIKRVLKGDDIRRNNELRSGVAELP